MLRIKDKYVIEKSIKKPKVIWYCSKIGSHIVSRSKEGLLIRGIAESLIFEVEAKNRMEASNKAHEVIIQSNHIILV